MPSMRNDELVEQLKRYGQCIAANLNAVPVMGDRACWTFLASVLLESADRILELQQRLARQAHRFEQSEARNEVQK